MRLSTILFLILPCLCVVAQYPEYRITDDGEYQYLTNKGFPGSVLDESKGTIYTPITIRTFFLEVKQKGYIPEATTYEAFFNMSIDEQRKLINQPYSKPLDCSLGTMIPNGCLVYRANSAQYFLARGEYVRRIPIKRAPRERIETVKMILHEE